jgi:hypothetical protein
MLVLADVPQLGTPQAIVPLLHGDFGALTSFGGAYLSKQNARGLAAHMPDAYALLPSAAYFAKGPRPVIDLMKAPELRAESGVYTTAVTNPLFFDRFLATGGRSKPAPHDMGSPAVLSSSLLSRAKGTHERLDAWTPPAGVRVVEVAGWGLDTVSGVRYVEKKRHECTLLVLACRRVTGLTHEPILTAHGDGTVVAESEAVLGGETYIIDLPATNAASGKNWKHADVTETPTFQQLLAHLIDPTNALPEHLRVTFPDEGAHRLRLRASSSVSLRAYDAQNRYVGEPTVTHDQQPVPNSYYAPFGEGKYAGLPAEGDVRVELEGLEAGTASFEAERSEGDVNEIAIFEDVPVTPSTRMHMKVRDGQVEHSTLQVDADGDGTIDASLGAGEALSPLSYAGVARRSYAALGLAAPAARQMCAKFANIEHILKRERAWDTVDDDADRTDVQPGEQSAARALRKLDRIEQWVLAHLSDGAGASSSGGMSVTASQAEMLLTIIGRLRTLLD